MRNENDIFEIMYSLRAMRRLKKDPVPIEMIEKILDAGMQAPSGQNSQAWAFVVVTDPEKKKFFGKRYDFWLKERFGEAILKQDSSTKYGRTIMSALHLSEHMHEAPVILMVLGKRDWPFNVKKENRIGKAPPSYGSIYPCVQNILLASRALGLGASLTTMHQMFEDEIHDYYKIPKDYGMVATIPIGFPSGNFGPVSREPLKDKIHYEEWSN
jgi:nitroreductase